MVKALELGYLWVNSFEEQLGLQREMMWAHLMVMRRAMRLVFELECEMEGLDF